MSKYTFYVVRLLGNKVGLMDNYTGGYLSELYNTYKEAQDRADYLNKEVADGLLITSVVKGEVEGE